MFTPDREHLAILSSMQRNADSNTHMHSMHMPGHANSNEITPYLNSLLMEHGGSKLEGSSDEHFGNLGNYFPPTGALKQSQELATSLYKTEKTFYGINGSTGILFSATRVLGGPSKKVLLPRNLHRSIIHGFRMTGAEIKFMVPDFRPKFGVFDPISYETIKEELEKDRSIDVIALTSPTYDGLTAEVSKIAKLCKENNVRLLVDGAHSSLYPFHSEIFPESGIGVDGVDMVVQSLHKAAGSFSQTSLLHLNKGSPVQESAIETAMFITSTTSPSNILFASMEESIYNMFSEQGKKLIEETVERATRLKEELSQIEGVNILQPNGYK